LTDEPLLEEHRDGVARLTMSRPRVHNAFDEHLILAMIHALERLADDGSVRVVILTGAGKSFSAGADLDWMRRMAAFDEAQNLADAHQLGRLLRTLDELPKPTLALVNGAAIGGGVGLVAAVDIAIAAATASFGLAEVRLGLIPAVIGPYVVRALGERSCRRLFLTGERLDAALALRLGLVHEVVPPEELEPRAAAIVDALRQGGPQAQREAKGLIRLVRGLDGQLLDAETARLIALRRASAEGREGIQAFFAKRPPDWRR
jgi:methylglutaconyl-CoA hydratase